MYTYIFPYFWHGEIQYKLFLTFYLIITFYTHCILNPIHVFFPPVECFFQIFWHWLWVYSRLPACSGSPTCPRWSLWCERRCRTSSCYQRTERCSLEGGDLWGRRRNQSKFSQGCGWFIGEVMSPVRICVYVHLMGPKEEDGDSFLVSALQLTHLNTHTEVFHELSQHRNIQLYMYVCVFVCVCVLTLAGQWGKPFILANTKSPGLKWSPVFPGILPLQSSVTERTSEILKVKINTKYNFICFYIIISNFCQCFSVIIGAIFVLVKELQGVALLNLNDAITARLGSIETQRCVTWGRREDVWRLHRAILFILLWA